MDYVVRQCEVLMSDQRPDLAQILFIISMMTLVLSIVCHCIIKQMSPGKL